MTYLDLANLDLICVKKTDMFFFHEEMLEISDFANTPFRKGFTDDLMNMKDEVILIEQDRIVRE